MKYTTKQVKEFDGLAKDFKDRAYQFLLYQASEENWDRTQYNEAVREYPAEVTLYLDHNGYIVAAICGMLFKSTAHHEATSHAFVWEWNNGLQVYKLHKSFGPNWRVVEHRLRKLVDTADDEIGDIVYLTYNPLNKQYIIDVTK